MNYVYVIYNKKAGKTYVGQTVDISTRLSLHNNHTFSRSYTARFPGEWVLIHKESVATRSEALKREKQLKSGNGRLYMNTLISEFRCPADQR